jgi:hypothetical protein
MNEISVRSHSFIRCCGFQPSGVGANHLSLTDQLLYVARPNKKVTWHTTWLFRRSHHTEFDARRAPPPFRFVS